MNTFAVPNTASGRAFIRHLRAFSVGMNVRVRGRGPRKSAFPSIGHRASMPGLCP